MKKTYFLSDLHLGAPYHDKLKETERRVVSFLDSIKNDAEAIYLLGDILDYWYEYKYVVPRGFVRFFGKLAELSDAGVKITWYIGNHDIWIFDYLPNELGIRVIDGYSVENINGKNFFLSHGDGLGSLPPSFKFIRGIFRNKICQKLFSGIHPRWTVPFAFNWSGHSRKTGEAKGIPDEKILHNLKNFSLEYLKKNKEINYFIFGHVHLLSREIISQNCEIIILGEWIRTFSYAVFDEEGLKLKYWL